MALAAWRIDAAGGLPARLAPGAIELEKHLEDWIEQNTALIDPGLFVLKRQMHVEGGILDLLCVDLQGRLTVIEIKRGKLIRETIAQAIDYASSVSLIPESALVDQVMKDLPQGAHDHPGISALANESAGSEREVAAVVVGVGREPGLERMIGFLGSQSGFSIRAVTFDVFSAGDGARILVREDTEAESLVAAPSGSGYSVSSVVAIAGGPDSPNGRRLLRLAEAAEEAGFYVRPYKWSLMFTPMAKKTRYLITAWKWGDKDELALAYSATAFAEFFPVDAERVIEIVGLPEGRHGIRTEGDADAWVDRIRRLSREISGSAVGDDLVETGADTPEPVG